MSYCDKCGFGLPESATFCPNCGAPIRKRTEVSESPMVSVGNLLKIGLLGAFLSVSIRYFSPYVDLYFIPSFISSLIVMLLFRVKRSKDALIIAMTVYLFADGIIAGITLESLYANKIPLASLYDNYVPTLVDVIMYTASPITTFIAGNIGTRFAPKKEKEPLPITERKAEEGEPGGIVYSLKKSTRKMPLCLIRFKYYLFRSSIPSN